MREIGKSFAQALFRLTGRPGVGLALSEEIVPIVLVGDLRDENISQQSAGSFSAAQPAVAGQYTAHLLSNPSTSSMNLIVTAIRWHTAAAGSTANVYGGLDSTDPAPGGLNANLTRPRPRDFRRLVSSATACQALISWGSTIGLPPPTIQMGTSTNTSTLAEFDFLVNGATFILPPGSWLAVINNAVAESGTITWQWREEDR